MSYTTLDRPASLFRHRAGNEVNGAGGLEIVSAKPRGVARCRRAYRNMETRPAGATSKKSAAAPGGRGGRARTRSGVGEGWGRDRGRVAPNLLFSVCCSASVVQCDAAV